MEIIIERSSDGLAHVLFPVKFEVNENFIDFTTIERTSQGIKDVYRGSQLILFGDTFPVDLVYGAAVPGSVTTWVGKKASAGAGVVAAVAVSQFLDGFVEEATGRTIRDWGVEAAIQVQNLPDHLIEGRDSFVKMIELRLVEAELCRRFLEMDDSEFESLASEHPEAAIHLQNGRRKFFEACRANEHLPSVRFGNSTATREIPRSDFSNRTKRDRITPTDSPPTKIGEWAIETLEIEVTSPNWERLDQQRGWKGKLSGNKYIFFQIVDPRFWTRYANEALEIRAPDRIVAQVIYQNVGGRYKNAEAIRVLLFNGERVSSELSLTETKEIVEQNNEASRQYQTKLFEEGED